MACLGFAISHMVTIAASAKFVQLQGSRLLDLKERKILMVATVCITESRGLKYLLFQVAIVLTNLL
jgi:hypothetical protein